MDKKTTENIVHITEDWIACFEGDFIAFFHKHKEGHQYCINGVCHKCEEKVPAKIKTVGNLRKR